MFLSAVSGGLVALGLIATASRRAQRFLTAAGMVAIVTAVLLGGAAGLVCSVLFNHALAPALGAGAVVAIAGLFGLIGYQRNVWIRADAARSRGSEIS